MKRFNSTMSVVFILFGSAFIAVTVWCVKTHHPWYITAIASVVAFYYSYVAYSFRTGLK